MASTIVLMQTDAFRDGLVTIIGWFNLFIDRFGLRPYLPLIGFFLMLTMIYITINRFFEK